MTPSGPKKPRPPQYSYYVDDARGVADHMLTKAQERGFAAAKPRLPRGRSSKRPGRAE